MSLKYTVLAFLFLFLCLLFLECYSFLNILGPLFSPACNGLMVKYNLAALDETACMNSELYTQRQERWSFRRHFSCILHPSNPHTWDLQRKTEWRGDSRAAGVFLSGMWATECRFCQMPFFGLLGPMLYLESIKMKAGAVIRNSQFWLSSLCDQ